MMLTLWLQSAKLRLRTLPIIDTRLTRLRALTIINTPSPPLPSSIGALHAFGLLYCYNWKVK